MDTQSVDLRRSDKVQRLAGAVYLLGEWDSIEETEDWVVVACRDETHALALQEMMCGDLDYRALLLRYIEENITIYNREVLLFMNAGQRTGRCRRCRRRRRWRRQRRGEERDGRCAG